MPVCPEIDQFRPEIRRLRQSDQAILRDHLQRLDQETRRQRFHAIVSDGYLKDYAARCLSADSVIFGAFPDGELRAVAELRGLLGLWPRKAEVALLVEPEWQDRGIGDALLGRLIAAAQNRGITKLHMLFMRENRRMRSLARKHRAKLAVGTGDVEATLDPPWPTPMSMFVELFGDTRSYLDWMFRQPGRTG